MTLTDLMEESPSANLTIDAPVEDRRGLFERAVCLLVEFRRIGTRRKVAAGEVKTDADKDMIHVSKDVLQAKTLDAINRADGEIRRFLERRTSGPALFRAGVYLLSYDLIGEVDAKLEAYQSTERPALIDAFMAEYEAAREDAKNRLGTLYDATDYPDEAEVRRAFGMRYQYIALSAPGQLESIRADIFQREQEKAAAQWSEALEECRQVLRAEMLELVSHAADRLTPGPDDKPKVFRDSLIRNMDEFLTTFSARNIASDEELQALVKQAREALRGVRPDDLRKQDGLRAAVATQMSQIRAALEPMVGGRRYGAEE